MTKEELLHELRMVIRRKIHNEHYFRKFDKYFLERSKDKKNQARHKNRRGKFTPPAQKSDLELIAQEEETI